MKPMLASRIAAIGLLPLLVATAGPARAGVAPDASASATSLHGIERLLPEAPKDPLAPFQLSLSSTLAALTSSEDVSAVDALRAGPDSYRHVGLRPYLADEQPRLPAPGGLSVAAGDFYFVEDDRMVEATLLVLAAYGAPHAIAALERQLGAPEFTVVLPGAMDTVVGWRTPSGCLLAWFDDLDVFRVTAFRADAHDVLAGAQIVLFDGLARYSNQLAAGASPSELAGELMQVVTWVAIARSKLEPVR